MTITPYSRYLPIGAMLYALMGTLAIIIMVTRHLDKNMYKEIKGSERGGSDCDHGLM
jgi:hypothetical protein